jgi:hypothetical protein
LSTLEACGVGMITSSLMISVLFVRRSCIHLEQVSCRRLSCHEIEAFTAGGQLPPPTVLTSEALPHVCGCTLSGYHLIRPTL